MGLERSGVDRPGGVLVVLCAASFLAVADTTIVSIAMPTIRVQLGFSVGGVQWVLNAYTLVFAGMLLLFGRLADRVGRRRTLLTGLLTFAAGSILAAAAPGSGLLVAGRVVQGLGAAAFVPSSLSLLTTTFVGERERSRALAAYGAMAGVGFVVGMVGGGIITQALGWRWIFWINVPIVAATVAGGRGVLVDSRSGAKSRLDVGGALAVTAGLAALVFALVSVAQRGWGAPDIWAIAGTGAALLTAFALVEHRHPDPLVPLDVLARARVLVPNAAIMLQSMVGVAWLYLLSLYFQSLRALNPLATGLVFAPMTLASIGGAFAAGRLLPRAGVRTGAVTGVAITAAGVTAMAAASRQTGTAWMIIAMVVGEAGFMLASVALTTSAATSLGHPQAGLAAGLYNTATQLGAGLGLAVVASVVAATSTGAKASGRAIEYGFLACLIFCVAAIVLIASRLRNIDQQVTTQSVA